MSTAPITFEYFERIKPYVRMTQRSKYVNKSAKEYLASKDALAWAMRAQGGRVPDKTPFEVHLSYHAPDLFTYDLDNLVKAVMDAGNKVMWNDDRYCTVIVSEKCRASAYYLNLHIAPLLSRAGGLAVVAYGVADVARAVGEE